MAVNCCVVVRGIEGVEGEIVIDISTALLTCTTTVPVTLLSCAVIRVLPVAATAVTRPEVLTVAIATLEEVQAYVASKLGVEVSQATVSRVLQSLDLPRKKNSGGQRAR